MRFTELLRIMIPNYLVPGLLHHLANDHQPNFVDPFRVSSYRSVPNLTKSPSYADPLNFALADFTTAPSPYPPTPPQTPHSPNPPPLPPPSSLILTLTTAPSLTNFELDGTLFWRRRSLGWRRPIGRTSSVASGMPLAESSIGSLRTPSLLE